MFRSLCIFVLACLLTSAVALADHGRGNTGGKTVSARTLNRGALGLELGLRFQESETFSDALLDQEALNGHDAHSTDSLFEVSLGASVGVTDRLTLSAAIPFVTMSGFRAAEEDELNPGTTLFEEADSISGIGDLTLIGKYALLSGELDLALLAGIQIPTGSTSEETDDGEVLEPDHQPGTGSWNPILGVALGLPIDERWSFGTSLVARFGTEGRDDFKPGIDVLLGAKVELQVTALGAFPRISLVLELALEWTGKDETGGVTNEDSGGTLFSIDPGIRARFSDHVAAALTVAIPVAQDLNGFQHDERYEILAGITYDF